MQSTEREQQTGAARKRGWHQPRFEKSDPLICHAQVINEILGIALPVPSREWLYKYMTDRGYSTAIQQWLGSNLVGTRGGFKWAFDISGAP